MPTYDYECTTCSHAFEEFQSITAAPLEKCPACAGKVRRLIGTGGGLLFKGSGFYQTDYRSAAYQKAAAGDKPAVSTAKKDEKTASNKDTKKAK